MRTTIVLAALAALTATLPGCLIWHSDTERDRPAVSRSAHACGDEVCAAGQDCVSVAGGYRCE